MRRAGADRRLDIAHDLVVADSLLVEQSSANPMRGMRHEEENRRDGLFTHIRLVGFPLGHSPDASSDLSKSGRSFFAAIG